MTESIITIAAKTSPYRSQIRARLASPGPSSRVGLYGDSSSRSRSADGQHHQLALAPYLFKINPAAAIAPPPPLSGEKAELRKLNDTFLSYIERVRLSETYNRCLTVHSEQLSNAQQRSIAAYASLKREYEEHKQNILNADNKEIQVWNNETDEIERQVAEWKNKQNDLQNVHETYRTRIVDLQKQCVDLQAKTEKLRFDYENVNDDNGHFRKQIAHFESLKAAIVTELNRERDARQRALSEVEELRMQRDIAVQAHEADTQALQIQLDNIFHDLTASFRLDSTGKNQATQTLNEIRQEYKAKDDEMRQELHARYLYEYNERVRKTAAQEAAETNREEMERRRLSHELATLNENRMALRDKFVSAQVRYKDLEMHFDREMARKNHVQDQYEKESTYLRKSIEEYEKLLNAGELVRGQTLEQEVNKYRELLEGSEQQPGLRQVINMSNKVWQQPPLPLAQPRPPSSPAPPPVNSNNSQPKTPPPVPPRLRQLSNSETSYATAPISQSTTATNQPFVTLVTTSSDTGSKAMSGDNDTDNDQSQTIQYVSGRSSRQTSESETKTPTNQETFSPLPSAELVSAVEDTIIELVIDASHVEVRQNETLPFTPSNIVPLVNEEQDTTPITKVEENEKPPEAVIPETVIPIAIEIDSEPQNETAIPIVVSPTTPMMSVVEESKPSEVPPRPIPVVIHPETEPTTVEAALPPNNPLAKLISAMLPNAVPFIPASTTPNTSSANSTSAMNNEALSFIPGQHQQPHASNIGAGNWAGGSRGGGNRRGGGFHNQQQQQGGGFHHGGGGNQRVGGGGNWQQSGSGGGGQHKQRRK